MFDYDLTLVKPKGGRRFPKDENDWEWLTPQVPDVLKRYYDDGYTILVFTNQTKPWKKNHITNSISSLEIPCTVVIAFDKAEHKPSTAMFEEVIGKKKWKKEESFFVGDALGRRGDFADTDRLFAEAIGVPVRTPEEEFLKKHEDNTIDEIKKIANDIKKSKGLELVVMVGYPGSGKSTIAEELGKRGYDVVQGDIHKTESKRMRLVRESLENKTSVVFDATNVTRAKRAIYIGIAKDLGVQVRCIYVSRSMEEAMELNLKRPEEKQVPKIAYYKLRKTFEEPTNEEGCTVIMV